MTRKNVLLIFLGATLVWGLVAYFTGLEWSFIYMLGALTGATFYPNMVTK